MQNTTDPRKLWLCEVKHKTLGTRFAWVRAIDEEHCRHRLGRFFDKDAEVVKVEERTVRVDPPEAKAPIYSLQ